MQIYGAISIAGASNSMVAIDGDDLVDLDLCQTLDGSTMRTYQLDDDSGLAELSPYVIAPTTNPGTKRWILQPDTVHEVDALAYGNHDLTQATIETALTAIGISTDTTLLLRPGTWVISSAADWSAYTNVTFKIVPGAVISHGAFTVNIPNVEVGAYQIFTGTGAITFSGSVDHGYLEWFGASPSATAAVNAVAIQKAIDSLVPLVISPASTFQYDTALVLNNNTSIVGANKVTSVLQYTGAGNGITGQSGTRLYRMLLEKFKLITANAANAGDGIRLEEYDSYWRINEVDVSGFGRGGMLLTGLHGVVRKCNVNGRALADGGYTYGIRVQKSTTAATVATTILLDENYISPLGGTTGQGIDWIDVYKCWDTYNIVENSTIGRTVTDSTEVMVSAPYYEANATDQAWHNSTGIVIGEADPNVTATWDTVSANYRNIRFISILPTMGDNVGQRDIVGSIHVKGGIHIDRDFALGYSDMANENKIFASGTYGSVNGSAPTTGRTYTLLTAVGDTGRTLTFTKYAATGTLTITPFGAETIAGESTYVLNAMGEHVTIISDGTNWQVIGSGGIKQVANADTSLTFTGGDTVAKSDIVLLQIEVNELKAALRAFGVIAP